VPFRIRNVKISLYLILYFWPVFFKPKFSSDEKNSSLIPGILFRDYVFMPEAGKGAAYWQERNETQ